MYQINFQKEAFKYAVKLPRHLQIKLDMLVEDLRNYGVVQSKWSNYSKLRGNRHHCHLNPRFVVIWHEQKRKASEPDEYDPNIEIIITYVGTRGDAPY
jgi:plasmid maintenance system killer protein